MEELLKHIQQYGLGNVLSIAILAFAWFLLKQIIKQYTEDRHLWRELIEGHFRNQEEAHKCLRKEHAEILEALQRLNGLMQKSSLFNKFNKRRAGLCERYCFSV